MIKQEPKGLCFESMCTEDGQLRIKLENEWISCPYNHILQVGKLKKLN